MKPYEYLHAFDFVLHLINADDRMGISSQSLKPVFYIDGRYWNGHLIRYDSGRPFEYFIDEMEDNKEVKVTRRIENSNNIDSLLGPLYDSFVSNLSSLRTVTDVPHLCIVVHKLIERTEFRTDDFNIEPVLYDAESLCGTYSFDFLRFSRDAEVSVASINSLEYAENE